MAPSTSVIRSIKCGNLTNTTYLSYELATLELRKKSSSHRGTHGQDVIEVKEVLYILKILVQLKKLVAQR